MYKCNKRSAALISIGIACFLAAGFISFVFAEEGKEIPDHTGLESCQACHAEKYDMWVSSNHGNAIRQIVNYNPSATDCSGCHSPGGTESEQPKTTVDNAGQEGFHQITCLACHARHKTEYDHRIVMDPEKLCDVCHTQRAVFWGKGAKGIEDSRIYHSGVPCIGCHMTEGNHRMQVLRPDDPGLSEERLDTCTACHMDNNREARAEQIQEYQLTYEETMPPLLGDIKAIEAALDKTPGLLDTALKSKFEDVKANLALLEKDGSRGFHNFVFFLEISSLASRDLKKIKASIP
jgi:predicted CXXCH cytochrome family protein